MQSPLITIPPKTTTEVDLAGPLRQLIGRSFGADPGAFGAELAALDRARTDAVGKGAGSEATQRDLLFKYFGQLELLELRFPELKVAFTWFVRSPPCPVLERPSAGSIASAASYPPFTWAPLRNQGERCVLNPVRSPDPPSQERCLHPQADDPVVPRVREGLGPLPPRRYALVPGRVERAVVARRSQAGLQRSPGRRRSLCLHQRQLSSRAFDRPQQGARQVPRRPDDRPGPGGLSREGRERGPRQG